MRIAELIYKIIDAGDVWAHCDIPCGIYSTNQAGIAAETVERMVLGIMKLPRPPQDVEPKDWQAHHNSKTRLIETKEKWAQICKEELWILWSDYFKEEHLKIFPNLHEKFWRATKLCSQNKREVNTEAAKQLRVAVEEISAMFAEAEGKEAKTYRKNWL